MDSLKIKPADFHPRYRQGREKREALKGEKGALQRVWRLLSQSHQSLGRSTIRGLTTINSSSCCSRSFLDGLYFKKAES